MTQFDYPNLPKYPTEWQDVVEPAKDAYWQARRDGKDETAALLKGIDEAFRCAIQSGFVNA